MNSYLPEKKRRGFPSLFDCQPGCLLSKLDRALVNFKCPLIGIVDAPTTAGVYVDFLSILTPSPEGIAALNEICNHNIIQFRQRVSSIATFSRARSLVQI